MQELETKIKELEERKQIILKQQKAKERKERTRRLIKIGRIIEKYTGEIIDFGSFANYIEHCTNEIIEIQKSAREEAERKAQEESAHKQAEKIEAAAEPTQETDPQRQEPLLIITKASRALRRTGVSLKRVNRKNRQLFFKKKKTQCKNWKKHK